MRQTTAHFLRVNVVTELPAVCHGTVKCVSTVGMIGFGVGYGTHACLGVVHYIIQIVIEYFRWNVLYMLVRPVNVNWNQWACLSRGYHTWNNSICRTTVGLLVDSTSKRRRRRDLFYLAPIKLFLGMNGFTFPRIPHKVGLLNQCLIP